MGLEECAGLYGLLGEEVAAESVGGDIIEEGTEDVNAPKVAARPHQPTTVGIEAHEITH